MIRTPKLRHTPGFFRKLPYVCTQLQQLRSRIVEFRLKGFTAARPCLCCPSWAFGGSFGAKGVRVGGAGLRASVSKGVFRPRG